MDNERGPTGPLGTGLSEAPREPELRDVTVTSGETGLEETGQSRREGCHIPAWADGRPHWAGSGPLGGLPISWLRLSPQTLLMVEPAASVQSRGEGDLVSRAAFLFHL